MLFRGTVATAVALLATTMLAGAAPALTAADKCEAGKLKVAGKYDLCRLKAEAKGVQEGRPPDYTKCDAKFAG